MESLQRVSRCGICVRMIVSIESRARNGTATDVV